MADQTPPDPRESWEKTTERSLSTEPPAPDASAPSTPTLGSNVESSSSVSRLRAETEPELDYVIRKILELLREENPGINEEYFIIESTIDHGGFASIFKIKFNNPVVVKDKLITALQVVVLKKPKRGPDTVYSFETDRESVALEHLSGDSRSKPFVPDYYGSEKGAYILMEALNIRTNLRDRLIEAATIEDYFDVCLKVVRAFVECAEADFIHLDPSINNIVFTEEDLVKLIDWGFSTRHFTELRRTTSVLPQVFYIATQLNPFGQEDPASILEILNPNMYLNYLKSIPAINSDRGLRIGDEDLEREDCDIHFLLYKNYSFMFLAFLLFNFLFDNGTPRAVHNNVRLPLFNNDGSLASPVNVIGQISQTYKFGDADEFREEKIERLKDWLRFLGNSFANPGTDLETIKEFPLEQQIRKLKEILAS